ncbi:SDR family NAD(P)-dependent oxidoreductase [Lysobacter sp. TAB13]|uniref:SDR family NAD(P)-dependent oxidoreductase n=1 Tax=Lysobacter sp. TAB13 TaxID=3233065 RepID=UPI003F97E19F
MNRFRCHVDVGYEDLIPRDHRVHAVRVVPGVTFFDLVLRALQARGIDVWRLELADVLFSEPVAVDADRGRRVALSVEQRSPQEWSVRASSRVEGDEDAPWRENFACTARFTDAPAPPPDTLRADGESLDLDVAYAYAREVGIEHFAFMKGEGRIDYGPQRVIAHLAPSALAREHAETFLLHPACLDSATLVPFLAAVRDDERGPQPFIPIHVRSFRAWAPLRGRCAVVVERARCVVQDDVFRSDILLCDPDTGACLARFEGLTTKRIRSPQLLERLLRPAAAMARVASGDSPLAAASAITANAQANTSVEIAPEAREPQALAERLIRELIAAELDGADSGDAETGFYDLGLESSHLLSISARLGERLAVSLYPTLLFEHSCIGDLAAHLATNYAAALAQSVPAAASTPVAPDPAPPSAATPTTLAAPGYASPAAHDARGDEPIAVIGLAGRYADAADVESLWHDILAPGRDCIREIPRERWDAERWFDPDRRREDRSYAKWGSFLPAIDRFDPVAFAISPREADLMDPQERLFLETASDTFGAAGYAARALAGTRTGVFVGVMWRQYEALGLERAAMGDAGALPMSFSASVANRVSHHFDLRGPSLALDSMCSSSLSALHLACESLRRGESDLALAGGVNLMVHPSKYLYLSRQQMLASDGRCRSFGDGGDGYVPGEGVGAVLLKRLSQAERDGDAILGVIRASALNHGGRAGGYTVPDPDAQAAVVAEAMKSAGLAADAIGYVEAHGTGTSLGDPIEVRGLEKAFAGERSDAARPCAIGSIKSNLGHLEAAAGIAGLTKLLLQLRHRRLAPSLHAQRLNAHIDFDRAGFAVQREGADWAAGADGLRRAGLSSFGAGGSNAHLIVEEYAARARPASTGPRLIVLSARSRAQLDGGAARLRAHLARVADSRLQPDLDSVAHTLMSRDDAHGVRAAIVVDSLAALRDALADLDGPSWRRGEPGRRREAARALAPDASRDALETLALAYVDGAGLAPQTPAGAAPAQRCALPTWPFLGRRCWLPDAAEHPLLGRRVPAPDGVCFERQLAREEAWLDQHRVDGAPALPGIGVALAMLAAADAAVPAASATAPRHALRDLRWTRLAAAREDGDAPWLSVECDGASLRASFDGAACAQAQAVPLDAAAPSLAVDAIRARCPRTQPVEACYRALAERGLRYGPDLRGLRRLDLGQDEALAEVVGGGPGLPASLLALDSALQAVTALLDEDGAPQRWRPAGIASMTLWAHAPELSLAHLRVIERSRSRVRFDIDLADAQGQGWASLHGVELRLAVSAAARPIAAAAPRDDIRCVGERWVDETVAIEGDAPDGPVLVFERDEAPLADTLAARIAAPVIAVRAGAQFARLSAQRYAIRPGHADDIAALLAELDAQSLRPRALVHAWARTLADSTLQRELDSGAHTLVAWFNRWFARRPTPLRVLYLHPPGEPVHAAVEGLARTAGREHPALAMTTIELAATADAVSVAVAELAAASDPAPVRWRDGRRQRLRRFEAAAVAAAVDALRHGRAGRDWSALTGGRPAPVCLISGGLGGLGRHLSRALAHEAGARVVLAGRRSAQEVGAELAELRREVPALSYRQADLSDEAQARELVEAIVREHGALDVVVHSAGVVRDGLLNRLGRADVDAVLAAKVHGALALDRATRHLPLSAFVAFSSVSGMIGNPGQAAYSYANRFLDRLAESRAEAVAAGRAHGRSWSIAWPLWRDGGMHVDAGTEALLERSLGMRPLQSEDGLACLHAVGASDAALIGFVAGDLPRIDAALALRADAAPALSSPAPAARVPSEARRRLLRERVSALLMLDPDAIDLEAGADDLGLDPTHLATLASDLQPSATVRLTALRIRDLPRLGALADLLEPESESARRDAEPAMPVRPDDSAAAQVRSDALATIRRNVADLLGLGIDEVDPDAPLREFGIDSITIIELTERLGAAFGVTLAPAAVFELERVADLVGMVEAAGGFARAVVATAPPRAQPEAAAAAPQAPTATTAFATTSVAASAPTRTAQPASARADDIAIVGMAGRFPGSPDLAGFWQNLVEVRDLIGEIPGDRWDWRAIDGDALAAPDQTRARWGGFIDGVDRFDAEFFRISPKQAEWMDPQHRLMLEATWAALADAGCDPEALRGSRTGVYIGIGTTDYHDRARALAVPAEAQSALGRAHSLLPNRISYLLDLHGPSLPFETACSSSLVAVDQAVAALRAGRCTLALVGGVNLMLDPYLSVSFDRAGMLSPRGRCRAFDAGADGYVRGEGLGMIVLKPLQQALADGDRIRAVIKGCAVNHGGVAHALTAPNPRSQARLLVDAYRDAQVDPLSLGYVEAHGTGTALGDPIEVRGLLAALDQLHREHGRERAPEGHCALGSVKANIGHLETAAGIAGLIKTVLCLEQRTIPGLAHFRAINPQIDLAGTALRIAERTHDWPVPPDGGPRRAGVSSFGFGGSNAHVVLEEAPADHRARVAPRPAPVFTHARYWLEPAPRERADAAPQRTGAVASDIAIAAQTQAAPAMAASAASHASEANDAAHASVLEELIALLSRVAKIPRERIAVDADFERYGLDSVLILELNHALRARFGELPVTVFYKYKTPAALAGFLVRHRSVAAPVQAAPAADIAAQDCGDVAVIGVAGRYPGAATLDALWANLLEGRHAISEIPASRWDYRRYFDPEPKPGRMYCKWGGFIDDVDRFDAGFFGVAPWLARYMDPQERLFLEQAWACVEDAGYAPASLGAASADGERRAPVGVFVGASYNEYATLAAEANALSGEGAPFNTQSFSIANRVSYCLGLGGPSMTVDTACSASLNAVHLACESLRSGACELAIAGGVNLSLHPNKYLMLCANRFAASDGRCRAFGEGGQGYVPGEGVGAVLLKPLAAARRDGDAIHAVIRGSAVNHDGKTFGYTVPNPVAQTEVIRAAWKRSGIDPRSIGYIEAHGTGTHLGDPIEIAGLSDAFASDERDFCAIGSVKSNIGHLEAAAGIAALHKAVLQLRHATLVPSLLHAERLNPAIAFDDTPFRVQTELAPWTAAGDRPLRAGVSSFGAGGVNAHVLLEQWRAPARADLASDAGPVLVPLSARDGERLAASAERLLERLEQGLGGDAQSLHDLAFTLQAGREAFASRLAIVASDADELARGLRRFLAQADSDPAAGVFVGHASAPQPGDAAALNDAFARGALAPLAQAWVEGCDWPWASAHAPGARRRLHLPTYPFAGERYWIEPAPALAAAAVAAPVAAVSALDEALAEFRAAVPAARAAACERLVATVVADVLQFERGRLPDPQLGLFAMGMESVQSAQLVTRLEQALDLTLYPTLVFDCPSIRDLARELIDRVAAEPERAVAAPALAVAAHELVLAAPHWQSAPPSQAALMPRDCVALALDPPLRAQLAQRLDVHDGDALEALLADATAAPLLIADGRLLDPAPDAFAHAFALAKRLLHGKRAVEWVMPHALDRDGESTPDARGLSAFARSLAMEAPRVRLRLLGVEDGAPAATLAEHVLAEAAHAHYEPEVRYRDDRRERRVLIERAQALPAADWTDGAVVLVSGGLGGLGLKVAERLGRGGARLALLARSAPTPAQRQRLDALAAAGVETVCVRGDVSVRAEVDAAVAEVRARFGRLDAVVHAAGCLRDGLLMGKSAAAANEVLSPKLDGCRHLDEATAQLPLRCFAVFASTAGLTGNIGQTDYAFANAWLDGFAHERARAAAAGRRHGRTLAFDWPLWADGGMQVSEDSLAFMAHRAGFAPMPDETGLPLFERALAAGEGQYAVFHGDGARIRAQFLAAADAAPVVHEPAPSHADDPEDAIAIVGMACRFPGGCDSPEALWTLLEEGRDAIGPAPAPRWSRVPVETGADGDDGLRDGGFLAEDPALFDAGLFGISPREAAEMDPQQRMLLEVAWHALEDSGIAADALAGSDTGVFVGITGSEYGQLPRAADALSGYTVTGVAPNIAAGRVARALGAHGPALTVDTACSSSLMAVHLARQSLLRGESSLALAAGVNLLLSPATFLALARMGALAPDGRCKTFAASADGYGRGEGCGVVVLERLADARRNGRRVLAVIRGSAVNHDGASSGLTVPNGRAQMRLLERALADARLDPAQVDAVEAHGTGTPLGDPIELRAIAEVYGRRPDRPALAVGAVKANLGHLEAAAGIAGLIKAVQCVRHGRMPAQPRLDAAGMNPRIALPESVGVALAGREPASVRIVGVSAFGFSGTNVHVLVGGDAPAPVVATVTRQRAGERLLCLSAASPAALTTLAARWRERIAVADTDELDGLCAASVSARARLRHRAAVVGPDADSLAQALDALAHGRDHACAWRSGESGADDAPTVALWVPDALAAMDTAEALAALDADLAATLAQRRERTTAQPRAAGFAEASIVVEALRGCGVRPARVLARGRMLAFAAWAAGLLDFDDAVALAADEGAQVRWREADAALIDLTGERALQAADVSAALRAAVDTATAPCFDVGAMGVVVGLGATEAAGVWPLSTPAGLAAALAALHVGGARIDRADWLGAVGATRDVPKYPMQRRAYWIAGAPSAATGKELDATPAPSRADADSPLDPIDAQREGSRRILRYRLSHARLPDLADNHGVLHIGQYLELLLRAARTEFGFDGVSLDEVEFRNALRLTTDEQRELTLTLEDESSALRWSLSSSGGPVHACGRLRALTQDQAPPAQAVQLTGDQMSDRAAFYARMTQLSFDLGPSVRWVEQVAVSAGEACARFAADPALSAASAADVRALGFHPGVLDAGAQLVAAAAAQTLADGTRFMVVGMDEVRIPPPSNDAAPPVRGRLRLLPERDGLLCASLALYDARERCVLAIDSLRLRRLAARDVARIDGARSPARIAGDARAFVRERVAAALDMDAGELHASVPLREMGIDSIVGLGLVRELSDGLGVDVPAELLLAGPSIDALLAQLRLPPAGKTSAPGRWFEGVVRRAQPRARLLCLPFGAGSASAYRRWSMLDPSIEVWPVQLPGRETRIGERPFDDMEALLDALDAELPHEPGLPLALYGQSMGGLIAFELARRLQRQGRAPAHVFIGGLSAPDARPNPYLAALRARLRARGLDDLPSPASAHVPDAFWQVFRETPEAAGQSFEHLRPILPMVLADLALVDRYRYRAEPALDVPITVLHGLHDDRVPPESLAGWSALTRAPVRQVDIDGDHFFIQDERALPAVATAIAAALLGAPDLHPDLRETTCHASI